MTDIQRNRLGKGQDTQELPSRNTQEIGKSREFFKQFLHNKSRARAEFIKIMVPLTNKEKANWEEKCTWDIKRKRTC